MYLYWWGVNLSGVWFEETKYIKQKKRKKIHLACFELVFLLCIFLLMSVDLVI
jgi:hypothetical protein